jgi:plasmid stabilization system protein ParE
MKVVISRQAQRDFAAQVRWLHDHSPQAGRRAATLIVEALDLLSDFPEIGVEGTTVRDKHLRFGRDGFVIRYEVRSGEIFVRRIYHSRQDRA